MTICHTQPIWGHIRNLIEIWENDLKRNSCFFWGCRVFFHRKTRYIWVILSDVTTDTTIDAAALGETRGLRISPVEIDEKS
jgi:hypothetical protein